MNRIPKLRSEVTQAIKVSTSGERPDKVETAARIVSALLLLGGMIGGGALFLRSAPAHAEREVMRASVAPQTKSGKTIKPNAGTAADSFGPRRVWVDPPPLPSVEQAANTGALARTVPNTAPPAQPTSAGTPTVPTECLPYGLRSVMKDIEARFGAVTLVSTTEMHTNNHSRGSVRDKLHSDCKAVDFTIKGNRQAVIAYLRSRPEVGGINSYGNNGVIHVDHNELRQIAQR